MSMFLRADRVTLDFPLHALETGHSEPSADLLGGTLHKVRGKPFVRALEDVSFDLSEGDRLALIGHNGSGKSTLLRVLAGIYYPNKGMVTSDQPVSGIFNMSHGFRPEATGYRNIVLKGLIAGKKRREIDAALPAIAEFTGLGPYLDMPLQTYSQGMAMRLAFAVTTHFSNQILVMDEWIGAGDAQFSEKIVDRMSGFVDSATILVVASHSVSLLRRLATKALWLEHGRIHRFGAADAVLDEYEALTMPTSGPAGLMAVLNRREGFWFEEGDASSPALAWNLPFRENVPLQLFVEHPSRGTQLVANGRGRGYWRLKPWVASGMMFRLCGADGSVFAELQLPTLATPTQSIQQETDARPKLDSTTGV